MKQYHEMLEYILKNGEERKDRTGTGTISVFGYQNRYDLSEGFPLVTTKKTSLRIIFEELKWFLNGDTNIKYLLDKNVNIWNEDAYRWYKTQVATVRDFAPKHLMHISLEDYTDLIRTDKEFAKEYGDLGKVYGRQWVSWEDSNKEGAETTINQISNVIDSIRNNPHGRRHIVSAWNVGELDEMALPPCHLLFQFYVSNDNKLSCQLYQRSADSFLGVPFNIASYSLLIHLIAHVTDLEVGEFIHTFGDAHIYSNHVKQVKEQLSREPMNLPSLSIVNNVENIEDFKWEDLELSGYNPYPAIKGKVSVGN